MARYKGLVVWRKLATDANNCLANLTGIGHVGIFLGQTNCIYHCLDDGKLYINGFKEIRKLREISVNTTDPFPPSPIYANPVIIGNEVREYIIFLPGIVIIL